MNSNLHRTLEQSDTGNALLLHLEALAAQYSQEIGDNLQYKHSIDCWKHNEIQFYTTVLEKLYHYSKEDTASAFYVFFDIDRTIGYNKSLLTNDTVLRPSFAFLLQELNRIYDLLHVGICSSRNQISIEEVVDQIRSEVEQKISSHMVFSSRRQPEQPLDGWSSNGFTSYHQKMHAMQQLRSQFGERCFLIDDCIQPKSECEQKERGISARDTGYMGEPLEHIYR